MLHHEESPEKPQYNMATPISRHPSPFCLTPSFSSKYFQTPPIPSILKKSNPLFMKGEGPNYVCIVALSLFPISTLGKVL